MGTCYRWVCDARREFLDPGELLGPACERGRGYGSNREAVPYSAWAAATLQLDRWGGHPVRLVPDTSGDYDCDGYEEVSQHVLRECLDLAPSEALRFLYGAVARSNGDDGIDHKAFLEEWARVDWPRLCTTPGCLHQGGRHGGECVLPSPEVQSSRTRVFALGMGHVNVGPGEFALLNVRYTRVGGDFRVERVVFGSEWERFNLRGLVVRGEDLAVERNLSGGEVPLRGSLTLDLVLRPLQVVEILARNTSGSRQTLSAGLVGTVGVAA